MGRRNVIEHARQVLAGLEDEDFMEVICDHLSERPQLISWLSSTLAQYPEITEVSSNGGARWPSGETSMTKSMAPAPQTSAEMPGITDRRFEGTILSFQPALGYGFVRCEALFDVFRKDVFLHKEQIGDFSVGATVSFGVFLNKEGRPQAKELTDPEVDDIAPPFQAAVAAAPALPYGGGGAYGGAGDAPKVPQTSAEMPGVTDERFVGTILTFTPEQGFGFIQCPELRAIFNKDVFLHKEQIGSFAAGDRVSFGVFLNKLMQPQAKELMDGSRGAAAGRSAVALPLPGAADQRYTGRIVKYDEQQGFGFIQCPELFKVFQKDIFVHYRMMGKFTAGSAVSFSVFLTDQGQPQAKDLTSVAPASVVEMPGTTDRRFTGTILNYDASQGYGFIQCDELKAKFKKDVFLHKEQVGDFGAGSRVMFGVFLNKQGRPQAKDLVSAEATGPPRKWAAASTGGRGPAKYLKTH